MSKETAFFDRSLTHQKWGRGEGGWGEKKPPAEKRDTEIVTVQKQEKWDFTFPGFVIPNCTGKGAGSEKVGDIQKDGKGRRGKERNCDHCIHFQRQVIRGAG